MTTPGAPSCEAKLKSSNPGTKPPAKGMDDREISGATLTSQLSAHRARSRRDRPEFVKAYDDLVARLSTLDRGEVGPGIGEVLPSFQLPDENGSSIFRP